MCRVSAIARRASPMKAIAVTPGKPNSVHLEEIPRPKLNDIPEGRGVLVRVLKVGVDATDREINDALYGNAPPGDKYLVLGHESFGVVEEVGAKVKRVKPGDFVTATVRRPGGSIYDLIGTNDMTSEETYYERGINLRTGSSTKNFVIKEDTFFPFPKGLNHLNLPMGPLAAVPKATHKANEPQPRI